MSNRMVKRHTKLAIFMHWFNAVCWFFLLISGIGLIQNPQLQPFGRLIPDIMRSAFGSGANLLLAHEIVGFVWAGAWLLLIVLGALTYTLPFMKQIMTYSFPRDLEWMAKKNIQMMAGYKMMALLTGPLGWDKKIPAQDRYNAGQKFAAVGILGGAATLFATGVYMFLSPLVLNESTLVQWAILIHFIAAMGTLGILFVHIYMAGISKEERPALISMFTGTVPEEYARHHHKLWYDELGPEEFVEGK